MQDETDELFENRKRWLKENIPIEEIYGFVERNLLCIEFLLDRLDQYENVFCERNIGNPLGRIADGLFRLRKDQKKYINEMKKS